jgi:dipeptidyl aminopeptidase/acylaminoacyl peptidase
MLFSRPYTYPDIWAGGISLYGISKLQEFVELTHKFESHYVQGLVLKKGVSKEEQEAVYRSRSAFYHADKIKAPLLLQHGSVDTVIPYPQSRDMEKLMRGLGKTAEVVIYEGEGHGWQMEETIRGSIEAQRQFWAKTLKTRQL